MSGSRQSCSVTLPSLHKVLKVIGNSGDVCKIDVFRRSKLAPVTVDRCFYASLLGGLIEGSVGDYRRHNYKLTEDGKFMLSILKGMFSQ